MKQFYNKHSIRIITGILAVVLIVMYIWLTVFTQNAHLTNPVYTRDLVEKIEIKNFIGRIELTTSDADGFKLEYTNKKETDPAGYYPLFKMGTPTIATIDGRFERVNDCELQTQTGSDMAFDTIIEHDEKTYPIDSYPILKISVKKQVILDIRKSSIFGFVDDIAAVKFIDIKCSDVTFSRIINAAEFDLHGNSFITAGNIGGNFSLKSTGKNTLNLQNINGNAIADMDGQTTFSATEITGNLITLLRGDNIVEIDNVIGSTTEN